MIKFAIRLKPCRKNRSPEIYAYLTEENLVMYAAVKVATC